MWIWALWSVAAAGNGPWVPGASQLHVYAGVEGQHFRTLSAAGLPGVGEAEIPVAGGLSTFTAVLDATYGLTARSEVELVVPLHHAHVSVPDDPVCEVVGLGACRATTTVGVIEARLKGLLLDEVRGAPLSLAVGAVTRFGALTASTRERLTGAGEGSLDFGGRLALGRVQAVGAGYVSASLDGQALYRVAKRVDFPGPDGTVRAPGPELAAAAEVLYSPRVSLSFGPAALVSTRPGGVAFGDLYTAGLDQLDRLGALRYVQARAGAKFILRDERYNAVSVGVFRTVYAFNNPNDVFAVGVGVSLNNLLTRRD